MSDINKYLDCGNNWAEPCSIQTQHWESSKNQRKKKAFGLKTVSKNELSAIKELKHHSWRISVFVSAANETQETVTVSLLSSMCHNDPPCLWAATWLRFIPVSFERWRASPSLSSGVYMSMVQAPSIYTARIDWEISFPRPALKERLKI